MAGAGDAGGDDTPFTSASPELLIRRRLYERPLYEPLSRAPPPPTTPSASNRIQRIHQHRGIIKYKRETLVNTMNARINQRMHRLKRIQLDQTYQKLKSSHREADLRFEA